jgi:hypothetical protein
MHSDVVTIVISCSMLCYFPFRLDGKGTKVVAKWDAFAAKLFNEICVEKVLAHNMPQHCFNNVGYANLVRKFYKHTKRPYNIGQMKNI